LELSSLKARSEARSVECAGVTNVMSCPKLRDQYVARLAFPLHPSLFR
jgi:hypothetical protein